MGSSETLDSQNDGFDTRFDTGSEPGSGVAEMAGLALNVTFLMIPTYSQWPRVTPPHLLSGRFDTRFPISIVSNRPIVKGGFDTPIVRGGFDTPIVRGGVRYPDSKGGGVDTPIVSGGFRDLGQPE